jgi:iron(III) transport system permease protein
MTDVPAPSRNDRLPAGHAPLPGLVAFAQGNGRPLAILGMGAALVALPFVALLLQALSGNWAATRELWAHMAAYVLPHAATQTALLLIGVAAVAGSIGVLSAWLVTLFRFPGRHLLVWLLPLPLAMPTYITAYAYADLLDPIGPVQTGLRALFGWRSRADYWFPEVRSLGGAIVLIGLVVYPYVYLAARTMFLTQSASLIEVARTLGARPGRLFRHVAIPLARPALAVGLALALLETLNDIGASEYLGVRTLTLTITSTWLSRGSLAGAAQIACLLLGIVVFLMWLEARGRRHQRFAQSTRRPRLPVPIPLVGHRAVLASIACALPPLLGLAVPAGVLVWETWALRLVQRVDAAFLADLWHTVLLAGLATLVTLALGLALVMAARRLRGAVAVSLWPKALLRSAGLGYAVPGTVLALGLLTPLGWFDGLVNAVARSMTGQGVGLVLSGSLAAIVVAYVIRFLSIATGSLSAGFERVSHNLDDAARALGARPPEVSRRIHLPLLRPALGGAALLIFVDCLKELPATLLLRPLNVDTLATRVYAQASQGSFENGALAALLIVAVGLYPVFRLTKASEKVNGSG